MLFRKHPYHGHQRIYSKLLLVTSKSVGVRTKTPQVSSTPLERLNITIAIMSERVTNVQ